MATEYKLSYTGSEINEKLGKIDNVICHTSQTLTDDQKAQARANIGAASDGEVENFIITATIDADELTNISATFETIYEAHNAGQNIMLHIQTSSGNIMKFPCTNIDADNAFFDTVTSIAGQNTIHSAIIYSDDTSNYTSSVVGGVTEETDPTVPDWAKAATKPTYTASEVGALPDTTVIPTVPTNVSAFANDAGYLTEHQSLADYLKQSELSDAIDTALAEAKASGEFDGADGNGISSATLNADYTLTLTFADGTSYTTSSIRGATGAQGLQGKSIHYIDATTTKANPDGLYEIVADSSDYQAGELLLLSDCWIYEVVNYEGTTLVLCNRLFSIKGDTGADGEDGTNGKSAYAYAQDGGYTGTEAEFAEKLAGETVEPADDDIPKVFLTGDEFSNMTTDKNEVNMELEYRSKTKQFSAYILIKYQGRSSLSKPKKNFTIKMYSDEARESKKKLAFKDWGVEKHKYVLKANFIDHTHSRNLIGAKLWTETVASRSDYDTLPEELRNSPRNGAVDGFPVKLYVNGTYQGIYTWNIGKDDWMWGMDEDNSNHVLLSNEGDQGSSVTNAGNFRKVWNGADGSHWSIEVGTNSEAVKTSLNNLITFIMNNNGDAFRSGIGTYLDVQSAIDYYIHQYVICNIDSLALNMLLATYDGTKWMLGAYDMDSTFGLWWTGEKFLSTSYKCPEDYQDKFSLLFERLEENYWTEIQTRYAELRKTVYTTSNMFTHFERFTDVIGNDLYAEDLEVYPTIPQGDTCNIKQLRNFIRDRLVYCDGQITNGTPGTAVTLSATSLTFDTDSGSSATLTATKTPSNATDDIFWYSSDTAVATVAEGVVTAVAEGSCTIYAKCGSGYASCSVTVSSAVEPDEPETPAYTNLVPTSIDTDGSVYNGTGYMDGYRLSSSGSVSSTAVSTATHTGFIKFTKGDIIRAKVGELDWAISGSGNYFNYYNTSFELVKSDTIIGYNNNAYGTIETLSDGSKLVTVPTDANSNLTANTEYYVRVSLNPATGANLIVTVNEEIT